MFYLAYINGQSSLWLLPRGPETDVSVKREVASVIAGPYEHELSSLYSLSASCEEETANAVAAVTAKAEIRRNILTVV